MRTVLLAMLAAAAAMTTTATAGNPPRFPAPRYVMPGFGSQLALGDVDGDGVLDIGAAVSYAGWSWPTTGWELSRGRPDGSFGPAEFISFPGAYNLAEFGDVDGDGDLDAITGALGGPLGGLLAGVKVLLNDGDGHFTPAYSYIIGQFYGYDHPMAVADFDGNGMADIAVVRSDDLGIAKIVVFLASGGGNFAGPVSYPVTAGPSRTCQAGDLDGDHDADLAVVALGEEAHVEVFLNEGDGTFVAGPVSGHFPSAAWDFQLADVDGDGHLDAVLDDDTAPILHVLPGQTDGIFGADVDVDLPIVITDLRLANMDGDGLPEAVLVGDNSLVTLHNLGGFAFDIDERLMVEDIYQPLVADLDIDGRLDILAPRGAGQPAAVLLQLPDGSHESADRIEVDGGLVDATLADLNGDGAPDLIEMHSSSRAVKVRLQAGDGSFPLTQELPVEGWSSALVGLLDADAVPDLVVSIGTSAAVALGLGDGTFGPLSSAVVSGKEPLLVDLTGDGKLDLVGCINSSGNKVRVLAGNGAGGFGAPIDWPGGVAVGELAALDLDGDGDLDLVAGPGSLTFGELTKWINGGGGALTQDHFSPPITANSNKLVLSDVSGDGIADLLAWPGDLCLGLPGANFAAPMVLDPDMTSGAVTLADLDADGVAEIVVAQTQLAYLNVQKFGGSKRTYSCGLWPVAILATDVNGDGRTDLVTPTGDGHVTFVTQLAPSPFTDLGNALAGSEGDPVLTGVGTLQPSTAAAFRVTNAKPFASPRMIVGFAALGLPFKGGVLVPSPTLILPPLPTNGLGKLVLGVNWPPSVPSGVSIYLQAWIGDAAGPYGFAATNGLKATTP